MLIGVDAGCLGVKDERLKTGVFRLSYNLLLELSLSDKENDYLLYSFYPLETKYLSELGERFKNIVISPPKGFLTIRLPLEFLRRKPDIFLALGQAIPPYHPFKTLGFIYDIAFERSPEDYGSGYKKISVNTRNLVKSADKIITISKSSALDISRFYRIKEEKLKVLYPGTDRKTFKNTGKTYKSKKPYFLFVGSLKKTKNVPRIIEAFHLFLSEESADVNFILAGSHYWMDRDIEKIVKEFNLEERVIMRGMVDDKELAELYRGAVALVTPAKSEGFGLPIMEAFATGCPVITSRTGAMGEIAEGNAIIVDPDETDKIAEAMKKIFNDKKLRHSLMSKGLVKAVTFTWRRFAEGVYEEMEKLRK
ncbi:MAG: Glycosyl transferase group 1 [Candidatus Gottesmanbacteria bacterium GW2011_GWC2_39_8]|uniref:Glycosyl transferase group 1 n=1 Tax=Candidatus Gottesmanbacteria bacterium GW2011_GWC2_39_8 TaxID=1618450 RepID=A0A0G0Q2V8_9BACT|nr:MAG: Glycosyl transferase group 1 [Candidatus Gottesmanbacteria bacterium GW2011_GWC2_39_8]